MLNYKGMCVLLIVVGVTMASVLHAQSVKAEARAAQNSSVHATVDEDNKSGVGPFMMLDGLTPDPKGSQQIRANRRFFQAAD